MVAVLATLSMFTLGHICVMLLDVWQNTMLSMNAMIATLVQRAFSFGAIVVLAVGRTNVGSKIRQIVEGKELVVLAKTHAKLGSSSLDTHKMPGTNSPG